MAIYTYTAKNTEGKTQTGQLEADNKGRLAALLHKQGLVLISAETSQTEEEKDKNISKETSDKSEISGLKQKIIGTLMRVTLVEKMMFTRHLSVMIESGLALNQTLKALAEQSKNSKFRKIIDQIEQDVRQGESFSEALSKHPKVFDSLYTNMVRVGESGGNLSEVLQILAKQMKKDHQLISRVRGAMMYPAVIVIAMLGIGIIMMVKVVPNLTEIFVELNIDLPFTTQIVVNISNFLRNNFIWAIFIFIGFIGAIRVVLKVKEIRRTINRASLYLPIAGSLIQKINSARFARTLSSLIESGVAIVESLEIVAGTLGNVQFKEALLKCAEQVQKGDDLSKVLSGYRHLYTPMVIQMIKVGEQTGNLSEILENMADFYEEEIDNITKNMSSIIEPVLMVVIGAAVGFFAISMLQPMYSMMGGL